MFMAILVPAGGFLYLHDSAVDLYLKTLREAIKTLPRGVLQLEHGCYPVITDYSDSDIAANTGIRLGYGYHYSDYEKDPFSRPLSGLVFCLNPPYSNVIRDVNMYNTKHGDGVILLRSSFMIDYKRFLVTNEEFNLDEIVCGELRTGEKYKRPEPYKPDPANPAAIPF